MYDETAMVNNKNEEQEKYASYEVKRLMICAHPNVLKCFGSTRTHDGHWVILLEYAENGDIESFYSRLRKENDGQLTEGAIPMSKRLELVFQLCSALKNMHALGIYHRDLKPQNLMISKCVRLLLGDFGATKDEDSLQGNGKQTGLYSRFFADFEARTK